MNPETNRFEHLHEATEGESTEHRRNREALQRMLTNGGKLLRPDGSPVPAHWPVFSVGEHVVIKDYTFKVAYIGEGSILCEPVGPLLVGEPRPASLNGPAPDPDPSP